MKNNNPHPIYTGLSLVLIVGAVASCDDSGTELACESGEHICIENSAQCENGNTELCLPDENMCPKWTLAPKNILNCEKCDSQCEADKTTCQNGLLRKCVVNSEGCNTWSDYGLCSEDTCNNECQNGESKCDNGQLMKCVIDSLLSTAY